MAECSWKAEPGEYAWRFSRDGNRLRLKVVAFLSSDPRRFHDDGDVVFECDAPLAEMERVITEAMREVLDEWGEDGYLAEWVEHRFPTDLLELVESGIGSA